MTHQDKLIETVDQFTPAVEKYFIKLHIMSGTDKRPVILLFHHKPELINKRASLLYCSKVNPGETLGEVLDRETNALSPDIGYEVTRISEDGTDFDKSGNKIPRFIIEISVPCFETKGKKFKNLGGAYMSWVDIEDLTNTDLAQSTKITNPEEYLQLLKDIGWFEFMSTEQREEKEKKIRHCFQNLQGEIGFLELADFAFNAEGVGEPSGNDLTGYPHLLRELAVVSDDQFEPLNVCEKRNANNTVTISFDFRGKNYHSVVENSEWYDESFIKTVNNALKQGVVQQRFFDYPTDDQLQAYCFVPEAAYKMARQEGVVSSV